MALATEPAPARVDVLDVRAAAAASVAAVLGALGTTAAGLSSADAASRRQRVGANAVRSHRARRLAVLARQLDSPLLWLLAVTATISFFVGERVDAAIIGAILVASTGLGFVNEYHAERAAERLHAKISHTCVVRRDGHPATRDVTDLVPGDVVELRLGQVVPADVRLLDAVDLQCDEAVLTGESLPVPKQVEPTPADAPLAELSSCALMGTILQAGAGVGVVVATGADAEFGRIALDLGERQPETDFQIGLRAFSLLLVRVALALTAMIFVINVALHRPVLDALLFSLAIAVGISPQLLPAVVSTSLAAGSRRLAEVKVLVKRLVCIEDLGDIAVLFTDKTGTLTDGHVRFMRSRACGATGDHELVRLGLACSEVSVDGATVVGGNPLDVALWSSPATAASRAAVTGLRRLDVRPFDHDRRSVSVLVRDGAGSPLLVVKGAPEAVLAMCSDVSDAERRMVDDEFSAGNRVVAVATRHAPGASRVRDVSETGLHLAGLLVFLDPPKRDARAALHRLRLLGIDVKIVTGDNATVATRVCSELGLHAPPAVTGADIDACDDVQLARLVTASTVFARVSPEQKARIVRVERQRAGGVAFLGDGVNDALALHAADVGISVDSATDVAKDAADVILLEKDLRVVADGVVEGRRIFANTIKYVLMGTSSNFGNMFSAALASAFLSFLPMLPSQILLNNLLYDTCQLAIPTDHVDHEQLARPSHWDVGMIRRFMLVFGPISSLFDFATFAVLLWVLDADHAQFRTGWFVESLATQTLIIFAIRTRRVPFFRSMPSVPLVSAAVGVVLVGAVLPYTPVATDLGFQPLPAGFFLALVVMIGVYLLLIEGAKAWFFRVPLRPVPVLHVPPKARRVHRRASRFSTRSRARARRREGGPVGPGGHGRKSLAGARTPG
jgi:Mg2+-importing ATPase